MTAPGGALAVEDRRARALFALNAAVVVVGIVTQLIVTARLHTGFFDSSLKRTLNVFAYFTIQSNLIVGATTLALATGRAARPRSRWCGSRSRSSSRGAVSP